MSANELLRDARVWLVCRGAVGVDGVVPEAAFSREAEAGSYVQWCAERWEGSRVYTVLALIVDEFADPPCSPGRPLSRMRRAELLDEARYGRLALGHCQVECQQWHQLADDYRADYERLRRERDAESADREKGRS